MLPRASRLQRRSFMAGTLGLAAVPPGVAQTPAPPGETQVDPAFPRQREDLIREVVTLAQSSLEKVCELVELRPALAKAARSKLRVWTRREGQARVFHPVGAPAGNIQFRVIDGLAAQVSIIDGDLRIVALKS